MAARFSILGDKVDNEDSLRIFLVLSSALFAKPFVDCIEFTECSQIYYTEYQSESVGYF
jgi:hypothetical protein